MNLCTQTTFIVVLEEGTHGQNFILLLLPLMHH